MEGRQRGESTQEREGCCRKVKKREEALGEGGLLVRREEKKQESGVLE